MIWERNAAVFYPSASCNLKCRYCGIDKNPALGLIDDIIAKSFENPEYYFEQVKLKFPDRGQLSHIETWGGEPFLHMDRMHSLLHLIINHYLYFDSFFSSTNFSFPSWNKQLFDLFNVFGHYPYRDFTIQIQLSCDGPEYINDAGRGIKTTKKCIDNFNKMVQLLSEGNLPNNITLHLCLKPTLDNETMLMLNTKQKIINYYKFFEETFLEPINNLKLKNVYMTTGIPNTAVPSPVTVDEGKQFSNICKLCREIEQENKTQHYLKYYTIITPFYDEITQNILTYSWPYNHCGTGTSIVSFLPDSKFATCHEGFTQFLEDYGKYALESDRVNTGTIDYDNYLSEQKIKLCVDEEGLAQHEYIMSLYNAEGTTAKVGISAAIIVVLAMAGQIEKKYMLHENALKAAIFMQGHTAYCIKDNLNITGSYTLPPLGLYKLLLNGAMQYIQHEGELLIDD